MNCLSLLLKDRIIRICLRHADLVRPEVHQKFCSYDQSVVRNSETDTLACQCAVCFLEAQVAQISHSRE